jgi:hypothetical protein
LSLSGDAARVVLVNKHKTHFAFRIDIWDDIGERIVEHVAGVQLWSGRTDLCRQAQRASWGKARVS